MKKFLFSLLLSVMATGASAQVNFKSVQAAFDWRGDAGFSIGTTIQLPANFDVTPSLHMYFPSGVSHCFSLDVDGHYDFDLGAEFHAYPIVGLSIFNLKYDVSGDNSSHTRIGANLGGGIDYDLDYNWTVFAEAKYAFMSDFNHSLLNIGCKYRF